jgi:hypothetical protein
MRQPSDLARGSGNLNVYRVTDSGTQPMAAFCGRVVPLGDSFAQRSFPPLPTPPPPLPPAPFGGFNPPQPSIPPPFPRQPPTPRPPRLPQTTTTPRPPPLISRLPHSHRDSPLQAALQRAHLVMNPFRRLGVGASRAFKYGGSRASADRKITQWLGIRPAQDAHRTASH